MVTRRRLCAAVQLLALCALLGGAGWAGEEASATLNVKLSVKGMTCSGCVNGVKAALEKVPGVKKAEVSLEKNEAEITYEKGKTTPADLVKAVEKAGFKCSVKEDKA